MGLTVTPLEPEGLSDVELLSQMSSREVSRHIHQDCPGHAVSMDSVKILDRDPSWFQTGVKEVIYIRAHKQELNRDGGRFILPAHFGQ